MQLPQFLDNPESLDPFKLEAWLVEARETGVAPEVRAFALGFPRDTRANRQQADAGLGGARSPSSGETLRYPPDIFATLAEATRLAREAVPGGRGREVGRLLTPIARQLLSRSWGDLFLEGVDLSDQLPTVAQILDTPTATPVPTTLAAAQILGERLVDAVRRQPERAERVEAYISRSTGAAYAHLVEISHTAFPRRERPARDRVTIWAILQGPTQAPVPAADAVVELQEALSLVLDQAERVPSTIPVLREYAARLPGLTKAQALLGLQAFATRPVHAYDSTARHSRLLREIDALDEAAEAEQQSRRTKQTGDEPHPVARHLATRR